MSVSEFEPGAEARAVRPAPSGEAPPEALRRLGARIDPPHVIDRGEAPADSQVPSTTIATPDTRRPDRLLRQARQLSEFLRQRRQELDRREALAHATIAQVENQDREARHWFQERQTELEQREALLAEREQALDAAMLAHQAAENDLAQQRAAVERVSERLARRTRRVEALERVLGRRRRETLEWRIALEELWREVAGRVDAVTMARRINELREQLADEFRETHAALARREVRLLRLQRELTRGRPPRRGRG